MRKADGMVLTTKILAVKASLQTVQSNQIQVFHKLFDSCNSNLHNTSFCAKDE